MNPIKSRLKRVCALLLTFAMLASFAAPASAFDDLSGLEMIEIVDITGGTGGDGITMEDNDASPPDEIDPSPDDSSSSGSSPAEDGGGTFEPETPEESEDSEASQSEDASQEEQQAEAAASAPVFTELRDGFSFAAETEGLGYRSSSGTTIYMSKIPGISHRFPFNGGNQMVSAYLFQTADGQPAYCIEPARYDSVNGDVVTGSQNFGGLSASKQAKIARAIASNSYGASNSSYYFACQAIIWQIAYGESWGSGNVYNAVIAANASLSAPYHDIISNMESGGEIPSFMSPDKNSPTQHSLTDDGSGSWRTAIPT